MTPELSSTAGQLVDVTMPKLSDSMEEATILQWLKRPGDAVAKGEPLVEVETDKATIVYEAEQAGVLAEIVVADNDVAALGAVIARLAVEGAAALPTASPVTPPATAAAPAAPAPVVSPLARAEVGANGARARATPVARRLARELGVSLDGVEGSGVGGRIVRADVRQAAEAQGRPSATAPVAATVDVPLTATQRTIVERMSRSRREIPDFTVEAEVDMEAAAAFREDLRALGHEPLPSFNDLIVRAVALALRDFPGLNAAFVDDHIVRLGRINVGIAVATEDSLIVPTIFDADRKSLLEIAAKARELGDKVRRRAITLEDVRDGSFTISNLGMFGVRRFNAVINPPQAAILAVGEVSRRPVVAEDGQIVARNRMDVALSCDHRVVYGAEAARFLQRLRTLLERPVALVIDEMETS